MKQTKKYALPFVVVIAVLLAFSSPAAADYSGDHPLTIYDHATINGGLIYETILDGSGYKNLNAILSETQSQDITIHIPEGATVKTARLYNTYCWSKPDFANNYNPGAPAEAVLTFSDGITTQIRTCQHSYADWTEAQNPIIYDTGVIHYWDTKNLSKYGGMWDFPSGEFAWDVTDMVTGSGTYTATITNADSTPTPGERFVTFGFGLLVIYEDPSGPEIKYWVTEGCDILMARTWETPENATTSATFVGSINVSNVKSADLTAVTTCADGGLMDPPTNMMYFNGEEIGPATAAGICHYGVNHFDVRTLLRSDDNVVEFQDRNDDHYVHNAFLVLEAGIPPKPISATVSIEPKTLILGTSGEFTASISLPEGYDVADIDINTVECGGAPALSGNIVDSTFEVTFSILDLVGVSTGDAVELTVTGKLTDGTRFAGNDTVSVKPLGESYSAIASGLEDVGERSTPAVFNMSGPSGTWYLIAGANDGTFNGYHWNGTAWVSDSSIVSGLGDVGEQSTPAVFYKDEDATWYLISGRSAGDFVGYNWTGTAWEKDDAIVSGLGTVVSGNTAPTVFCMDGTWYLISGNAYGRFDYGGRRWDAANSMWVEDSDIVSALGDVGEDSTSTVFNKEGTWYLIAGAQSGTFTGYLWTGTVWKPDLAIVSGLEDIGENSAPALFNMDGAWYLISGDTYGTFNGFRQVCIIEIPAIPASVTFDLKKVKLNSNGILKAFITLPEPYDVANIDINTVTCEGATVIGSKITGKGVLEAKFEIPDLKGVPTGDAVRLTVTGELTDRTAFEGSDIVTVTHGVEPTPTPDYWVSDSSVVSGLGFAGGSCSTPTVFNKEGTWYHITGNLEGTFRGWKWTGLTWESDSTMISGLGDIGYYSAPTVFNKDGTWYLISGRDYGSFFGFQWTGSMWESDSDIVSGLPGDCWNTKPEVFNKDGTWYLIFGEDGGAFYGYKWTGSAWESDDAIVSGLGDSGCYSAPTVFNKEGLWHLITGSRDGVFYGFKWTGSAWQKDDAIVSGLGNFGDFSHLKPDVFYKDGTWNLISGLKSGYFYGFRWQLLS